MDPFFQQPPEAGNRFHTDPTLRLALQWRLPDEVFRAAAPHLEQLGEALPRALLELHGVARHFAAPELPIPPAEWDTVETVGHPTRV